MDMIELVQKYSNKLKNNPNDISYLLFALQIPSICSRIEFPKTDENTGRAEEGKLYRSSGKPWDANLYKAWLRKHYDAFEDMLIAFANEHFEPMNNGKMQLRCWVDKHIIGTYTFEEFKKNDGYIRQLKPSSRGKYVTDESDFVDVDKSFAEVFPYIEKGKLYYIDDESYFVAEKEN